jgi:hypothetical protein
MKNFFRAQSGQLVSRYMPSWPVKTIAQMYMFDVERVLTYGKERITMIVCLDIREETVKNVSCSIGQRRCVSHFSPRLNTCSMAATAPKEE